MAAAAGRPVSWRVFFVRPVRSREPGVHSCILTHTTVGRDACALPHHGQPGMGASSVNSSRESAYFSACNARHSRAHLQSLSVAC
eukprot:356627-Chlamydomonas_euryale.AAC.2